MPMVRSENRSLLLPAMVAALAMGIALFEWALRATAPGLRALWVLWSVPLMVPAVIAWFLGWRLPRLPTWLLWWALLWPTACIVFHQFAHEYAWPRLALGVGGLQHWSRVAGICALATLPVAIVLDRAMQQLRAWLSPLLQLLASCLLLLLLASTARSQFGAPPLVERADARERWPNVLLISIDTLRQDALAPYGGPSSALDPWFAQANALDGWSPSPWTLPALRAMMRGASSSGGGAQPRVPVPPSDPWWPEILQRAGYHTAAVLSNVHLVQEFHFDRGFDDYDHSDRIEALHAVEGCVLASFWTRQWVERRWLEWGDRRADAAVDRLGEMPPGRPWFLWLHMLDPHIPYYLRGEQGELWPPEDPAWSSALGEAFDRRSFSDLEGMRDGRWPQSPEFLDAIRKLYAREVDFAAFHAARVLEAAHEASADRPLLWILTSDHGEEFFEHGGFEHGHALTPELLQVPLVIGGVDPSLLPRRMRLQDLGPWLLAQLALDPLPSPSTLLSGNLADAVLGSDVPREGCAPSLLATNMLYGGSQARWIRPDGRSTLWDGEGRHWHNDLCVDPMDHERAPAPLDSLERVLLEQLAAWRREENAGPSVEWSESVLERLRALGYAH